MGIYINADTIPGSPTLSQVPMGRPSLRLGVYQKGGAAIGQAVDYPILPRVSMHFATPLKFYNIITPNHDGLNDVFIIENVTAPLYAGNPLRIFSR